MAGSDAQAGFYYQNLVAALHLLDLLEIGSSTSSVMLENPSRAKHIDDIIVDSEGGTRFIQVKWSQSGDTSFTLANLISSEDGDVSLWMKLARGFTQIQDESGKKVVELLSTKRAGENRQPSLGFDRSLAEFLGEFHDVLVDSAEDRPIEEIPTYERYASALKRLHAESGITSCEEFVRFLRSLRFTLGEPDREALSMRIQARLTRLGIERHQYGVLLDHCVRWSLSPLRIQPADVLEALGLTDRFAERLSHRFPVDEALWVSTPAFHSALDRKIDQYRGGYIAVFGEPGAGKSTSITKYLNERPDVLFGYYCFIPNDQVLGNERLEQEAFTRAICAGLKTAFPDFPFPHPFAQPSVTLLNEWLAALSAANRRTVFLVDGLDHVFRKQQQSALTKPLTEIFSGTPPDNVLIIVTARYEKALPVELIELLAREPDRRMSIDKFDESQVAEFMRRRGVNLDDESLARVFTVSAGLPIYLQYLAGALLPMTAQQRKAHLRSAPALQGADIDRFHRHLWQEWESDSDVVYLMAILALREEFTSSELLLRLIRSLGCQVTLATLTRKIDAIQFVLKVSEAKGLAISHASFAEFILEQTRTLRSEITRAILAWYEAEPSSDEAWRHRFRHLFDAGEHRALVHACDEEWVNRAWESFRPLAEVQRNLNHAWAASIRTKDLLSFIRIAFLKQQAALIDRNVDMSNAQFAEVLLDFGLTQVALNMIWDGEQTFASASEFAQFAHGYFLRLKRRLPSDVLRRGLGSRKSGSFEDSAKIFRVAGLVVSPRGLLQEIDQLRWRTKSRGGLAIQAADYEENAKRNSGLKLRVLAGLAEMSGVDELIDLAGQRDDLEGDLQVALDAALAVALGRAGALEESQQTAATIAMARLPFWYRNWALLQLHEFGVLLPRNSEAPVPAIPLSLEKEHRFNTELLDAYDEFRIFLILRPGEGGDVLRASTMKIAGDIAGIAFQLIALAAYWVEHAPGGARRGSIRMLEGICEGLDLRKSTGSAYRVHDQYAYFASVYRLYRLVWQCAVDCTGDDDQLVLARYWLAADGGKRCVRLSASSRELAIALASNVATGAADVRRDLLRVVEKAARAEEETASLATSLLECARAWGICGFREESIRIWKDIATVACGVHSRKDYQFSEIFFPLKLAHLQDSRDSRARLAEQVALAHQLEDTGAGKQVAIALEGLIEIAAEWWPVLALRGLAAEDDHIFRERGLAGVLSQFVKNPNADRQVLLALLKTFAHWDNYRVFNDETAPAMQFFFEALLQQGDFDTAYDTYTFARHLFLVEKQMPDLLATWAALWVPQFPARQLIAEDVANYPKLQTRQADERGASTMDSEKDLAVLSQLDPKDLAAIKVKFQEISARDNLKRIESALDRSRGDWKRAFLASLDATPVSADWVDSQVEKFVASVLKSLISGRATEETLRRQIVDSLEKFGVASGHPAEMERLEAAIDVDEWLASMLERPRGWLGFGSEVSGVLRTWIEKAPFVAMDDWQAFVREFFQSDARAIGLLAVAQRLSQSRPEHAYALLEEACECVADFLFEHQDLCREICFLAMELDRERATELILEGFRHQYTRFPEMLVLRLDTLIERLDAAAQLNGVELYRVWCEHNKRLVAGLTDKPADLAWISSQEDESVESACVGYLLSLLKYPQVDVRLLSVEALVDLLQKRTSLLPLLRERWKGLTFGQREYVVSVISSLLQRAPSLVGEVAWVIDAAAGEAHYAIRAAVADVFDQAGENSGWDQRLATRARRLVDPTAVLIPLTPKLHALDWSAVRLPAYARWCLQRLGEGCKSANLLNEEALRLLRGIYSKPESGLAAEMAVHRAHNINSNFDNLEIAGEFDEACRSAINMALVNLLEAGEIDAGFLREVADVLRIRDASDSLLRTVSRPSYVDWVDPAQGETEFLAFQDFDAIVQEALRPRDGYLRVFEYAEQREGGGIGSRDSRVTIIRLELFGVARTDERESAELVELAIDERVRWRNAFRTQLRLNQVTTEHNGFIPLVVSSTRAFRGRPTRELAALSAVWQQTVANDVPGDLLAHRLKYSAISRSTEWQGEFDQDRRRHEPKSTGFLLEVSVSALQQLADDAAIRVYALLEVERTTDRFKPEGHMAWVSETRVVAVHAGCAGLPTFPGR
jgi:hypothetical protein